MYDDTFVIDMVLLPESSRTLMLAYVLFFALLPHSVSILLDCLNKD